MEVSALKDERDQLLVLSSIQAEAITGFVTALEEIANLKAADWHLGAIYARDALTQRRDSDGTATAALCEDIAVPQDCQARAESIAQTRSGDS